MSSRQLTMGACERLGKGYQSTGCSNDMFQAIICLPYLDLLTTPLSANSTRLSPGIIAWAAQMTGWLECRAARLQKQQVWLRGWAGWLTRQAEAAWSPLSPWPALIARMMKEKCYSASMLSSRSASWMYVSAMLEQSVSGLRLCPSP